MLPSSEIIIAWVKFIGIIIILLIDFICFGFMLAKIIYSIRNINKNKKEKII
jgi:hypothetical protein